MKVLVFGAAGQLGQAIKKVAAQRNLKDFCFLSREEVNILDNESLKQIFEREKPGIVINCAAYTAVDLAEDEQDNAHAINCIGASKVAEYCNRYHATLIHVSTDFVFGGAVPARPLTETDPTNPMGVYAKTKLSGELSIATVLKEYIIIRTSWLYAEFGNNFVKTMLRLGKERKELGVVADQIGTPTYAVDLAHCILDIISRGAKQYGLYHYSNEGVASWYDFAKAIFDIAGIEMLVKPLKTSEYPVKAARPSFSVLDKSKIKSVYECKVPYWRDSLAVCIKELETQYSES